MLSKSAYPEPPRNVIRRWQRKVRRTEQTARLQFVINHVSPPIPGAVLFFEEPQHDFGDPRYYDWSGTKENRGYGRDGRAKPFDLVVGPPRPPHRSSMHDGTLMVKIGLEEVREMLAEAREIRARRPLDIQTITIYHPILVVHSPLVSKNRDGTYQRIEWTRHERNHIAACDRTWIDVISGDHFNAVMKKMHRVYGQLYERLRCAPGLWPVKALPK